MAASQPNLPQDVLVALEDCIKAAEKYGYACAGRLPGDDTRATAVFQMLQEARRTVVRKMEEHATRMYESGIDMGRAQEGAL